MAKVRVGHHRPATSFTRFVITIALIGVAGVWPGSRAAKAASDPISGTWEATFLVESREIPGSFTLKLDGNHVTGTMQTEHTGQGTIRDGSWLNNHITITVDFAHHDSIEITGALKDGKLAGEFSVLGPNERTQGKWEASRKQANQS